MLTPQQINDARKQLNIQTPGQGTEGVKTDWNAPDAFAKPPEENQQPNNMTGQGTVPMDWGKVLSDTWGKVLSDTWSTYKNAPKDFLDKETNAINSPDIPLIGKSNNATVKVGEAGLAGTASIINTIFAPFGALTKGVTDSITKQITNNPDILKSPAWNKVADFVQGASGHIQNLVEKNPRAAKDLGNALTVIVTALSGEEGGKLGLFEGKGMDTAILPGTFSNPKPLVDAIKNAPENIKNAVIPQKPSVQETINNFVNNPSGTPIYRGGEDGFNYTNDAQHASSFGDVNKSITLPQGAKVIEVPTPQPLDLGNDFGAKGSTKVGQFYQDYFDKGYDAVVHPDPGMPDKMQVTVNPDKINEFKSVPIKPETSASTLEATALKNATPDLADLSPSRRAELLKNQGINPETILKKGTVNLTPNQMELIKENPDLFQGKTATENYYNVENRIASNDMSIKAFLDDNKVIYDKAKLRESLIQNTKDITDPMAPVRFEKAKLGLIDNVVNSLEDEKASTLLNGRQAWDRSPAVKTQLEALFSGKETTKGLFGKAVRDTMNDTIDEKLPNSEYKDLMKQSSGLIDIRDNNLLPKALKTMNKSQLQQWIQKTPGVKALIKAGRLTGLIEGINMLGH